MNHPSHAAPEGTESVRITEALLTCSQALLHGVNEAAIDEAMAALLDAAGAEMAYVDVNVDDPELGPSFQLRYKATVGPLVLVGSPIFERKPWSELPIAYMSLGAGDVYMFEDSEDIFGVERPVYAAEAGQIRAKISVPVFVDGIWVASIGLLDRRSRKWSQAERRMMRAAADMFSSFFRREITDAQLRELLVEKDQFIASVSHELRTPLAAVLGFATELRDAQDMDEGTRRELIDLTARQAQEVSYIVDDLLVAARAQRSQLEVVTEPVDPVDQVELVLEALSGSDRVKWRNRERCLVCGDPQRLRQVVRNLLINAIRYGGENIWVDVVSEASGWVTLSVVDDGPGIPETQRDQIFHAYQSMVPDSISLPALPSVGLGLTVSRELVRLMGGDIHYRYHDESIFEVRLRVHSAEVVE